MALVALVLRVGGLAGGCEEEAGEEDVPAMESSRGGGRGRRYREWRSRRPFCAQSSSSLLLQGPASPVSPVSPVWGGGETLAIAMSKDVADVSLLGASG